MRLGNGIPGGRAWTARVYPMGVTVHPDINHRPKTGWVSFRPPRGLNTDIVSVDVYCGVIHGYRAHLSKRDLSWRVDTVKQMRAQVSQHEKIWEEVRRKILVGVLDELRIEIAVKSTRCPAEILCLEDVQHLVRHELFTAVVDRNSFVEEVEKATATGFEYGMFFGSNDGKKLDLRKRCYFAFWQATRGVSGEETEKNLPSYWTDMYSWGPSLAQ